jgi:uncharacterized protein (TIGR02271 family)
MKRAIRRQPPDIHSLGGSIMQHTLISVFEDRKDAEHAKDDLLAAGFSGEQVRVSKGDSTGITDSVTGRSASDTHDEGFGSGIKHFFQSIFGTDNSEYAQKYTDAVSRGHHVLTIIASDEVEVERAADIVERHGPVDIDEKHAEWAGGAPTAQPESMRMSGAGGMQQSAPLSQQSEAAPSQRPGSPQQEGSLTGSSQQGASLTGSQQRDTSTTTAIPVVQEQLKVGKREVQRGGVRVFSHVVATPVNETIGLREEHVNVERHAVDEPISPNDATAFREQTIELRETAEEPVVEKSARVVEEVVVGKEVTERDVEISDTIRHTEVEVEGIGVEAGTILISDDDAYRTHWTSNYAPAGGTYEDVAPAYRYGNEMASSDKYRGRKWDEVESDLRSDWESRDKSGGASTWERFKSAIRHGWDRITS